MRLLVGALALRSALVILAAFAAVGISACDLGQLDGEDDLEIASQSGAETYACETDGAVMAERAVPVTNTPAPDPWEFSETTYILGPPPANPGYRARPADLGFPDPDADAMDHIEDSPNFPLYRDIAFAIGLDFDPDCGRGRHLIAPPSRIDELIARALWRPNELAYRYKGEPGGLQGYERDSIRFVDADRSTQCRALGVSINEAGRIVSSVPFPVIQCSISNAPYYRISIVIPARHYGHLGEILTRIDQDARLLVDGEFE